MHFDKGKKSLKKNPLYYKDFSDFFSKIFRNADFSKRLGLNEKHSFFAVSDAKNAKLAELCMDTATQFILRCSAFLFFAARCSVVLVLDEHV